MAKLDSYETITTPDHKNQHSSNFTSYKSCNFCFLRVYFKIV